MLIKTTAYCYRHIIADLLLPRKGKILTLLISAALLSVHLSAQNYLVSGSVVDETDNTPLEDVSVILYKSTDSTLLSGTLTKKDGSFLFTTLEAGTYSLVVKSIGYESRKMTVNSAINSVATSTKIAVHRAGIFIDGVTVKAGTRDISVRPDKQVYKSSHFQSANGGTAVDVLKNIPSVAVNAEGEISVRGALGFLILINGKPVQADAGLVLNQIPANAVEDIQLITAPSAKYDPDGKAGIINITTKTGPGDGWSVSSNIQGGFFSAHDYGNKSTPVRFGVDATTSYKKRIWEISAGVNYLRNDAAGYREGNANTTINSIFTSFPSNGERSFKRFNYSARASLSFAASKRDQLSAGFYYGKRFQARTADILYNNSKTNLNTGEVFEQANYFNTNLQTKQGSFSLGSFDYAHVFKNKSALTISLLMEYANLYGDVKNANLYYPEFIDTIQYTYNTNTNPLHGYRAALNYTVKTNTGQFESGYQFRYDQQDGNFIYITKPGDTSVFIIDPDFTSRVYTANHIHSIYIQYSGRARKLDYNGGLRYEYATRKLIFSGSEGTHRLNLSNLFPSASLFYSITGNWKLKVAYSRRIQRTKNNELNPLPEREHSETLEQGDADLLPEFIHLAELGITRQFKGGSFFSTAYYQEIKNPIQRVNSVFNDSILNRIYTNAGRARLWGIENGVTINPVKKLQVYAGINVYHYKIAGSLFKDLLPINNTKWTVSCNSSISLHLSPSLTGQLTLNYISAKATAQGEDSYFISPNCSLKKTFLKGRLYAMAQWQNIDMGFLNANRQRITTAGINFYTTTNYIVETDVMMLHVGFTLNSSSKKTQLPASEFGEKEF